MSDDGLFTSITRLVCLGLVVVVPIVVIVVVLVNRGRKGE